MKQCSQGLSLTCVYLQCIFNYSLLFMSVTGYNGGICSAFKRKSGKVPTKLILPNEVGISLVRVNQVKAYL